MRKGERMALLGLEVFVGATATIAAPLLAMTGLGVAVLLALVGALSLLAGLLALTRPVFGALAAFVAGVAVVVLEVYEIATMRDSFLQPFYFVAGVLIAAIGMHWLLVIGASGHRHGVARTGR